MGLKDLLAGNGARARPVSLKHRETELCREVASARPGTLTAIGGDLVLTNRRLIFTPLDTKDAVEVLIWVLESAGAPGALSGPGRPRDPVQQQESGETSGLRGMASVSADGGGGWLRPPAIVVAGTDGSTTEIGVLAGRRSMNRDRANVVARDRMLAAIQAAVPRGR